MRRDSRRSLEDRHDVFEPNRSKKSSRRPPRREPAADPATTTTPADGDGREGTVTWLGPGACVVRDGDATVECALPAGRDRLSVAVGDVVAYARHGEGARVTGVRPRRTSLSRPDPHDPGVERVIAANVDVVVVVASVVAPPLRPRLIDRYLVAIARGGAAAVVCVNKVDLLGAPEDGGDRAAALAPLAPYAAMGVPVVPCSSQTGEGLDALRAHLAGTLCAFVGHSGVGKSSLVNALLPGADAAVGAMSEAAGKGRHTTTASTLRALPDGTRVVDTPGVRSFGLWAVNAAELGWYFPEFEEPAARCRFRDCTHDHEPRCGVRDAVAAGAIPAVRYETYLRILATLNE